jgi:hypothetical protein
MAALAVRRSAAFQVIPVFELTERRQHAFELVLRDTDAGVCNRQRNSAVGLAPKSVGLLEMMVAPDGFEPPTKGL